MWIPPANCCASATANRPPPCCTGWSGAPPPTRPWCAPAPHVLFIGAAGNGGDELAKADQATRFALPNFLLVGAVDEHGQAASWSNTGPEVIIRARGERVPARLPDGTLSHPSGTSMAAPVVANAVAKMLAAEPGLSVQEIRTLLLDTATPMEDEGPPLLHTRLAVRAAARR